MYCNNGNCVQRGFLTREEKIDALKSYKDALDKESEGVSEKIAVLQKEN